ncbi:MAG: hypothetical protein JKY50_05945 [Oleispira sp.]|nr:hypothetical protein [Oleispira sp.]MBL4880540.1 hypothetical protein [Oleispira sp.]
MKTKEINRFLEMLHSKSKDIGIKKLFNSVASHYKSIDNKDISYVTFSSKLNPNIETHKLNIEDVIFVILELKKSNDHGVVLKELMSIFEMHIEYVIPDVQIKKHNYVSFMNTWMKFNKEHSDIQIALNSALDDYKISRNELKSIKTEIEEQIEALSNLRIALDDVCGRQLA